MRSKILAAIFWLGLVSPVWAVETGQGEAEIVANGEFEKGLSVGGTVYDLPSDPYLAFIEGRVNDWLLILVSQGGNACAGEFTWAMVEPDGVSFSPVFGTCVDAVEIEELRAGARVTMDSGEVGQGPVSFTFDGETLTFEQEPQDTIGWSMGQDASFWEGRYLFDLLGAAEMQAPLKARMTKDEMARLERNAELGGPMAAQGDWIVGTACQKGACDTERSGIAISRDGQRLIAAYATGDGPPAMFGDLGGEIPQALREIAAP